MGKLLLRLSLPGVASMITMSLYSMVDTIWVGKLGYQAIAATTIIFPYFILAIAFGVGTGVGANALASRRFGERNIEATNRVAGQLFSLSAIFGVFFVLAAVFFAEPILVICGAPLDIMDFATEYLIILGWGIPFFLFRLMTDNVFRASGDAIKPMIFSIVGTVINIVLDPFLIFGWGPFPEMGIGGAALATVIASLASGGLSFYYLVANKSVYRIKLHHLKPDLPIIRDIYRVGLPSMLMEVTESVVFALFNYILARFGSVAIAAAGIAFRVADLAFMPIFGASHGLLPVVGFCFGARLWHRLWRAFRLASVTLAIIMALLTVIFEIYTPQIIAIFNADPQLMAIAVPAMRIFMSPMILFGPAVMIITTFQGLSMGKQAMVLSLVRQLVFFVPALFLLSHFIGINGVWISMPLSDTLSFIVSALWLYREYRLQKRTGKWDIASLEQTDS